MQQRLNPACSKTFWKSSGNCAITATVSVLIRPLESVFWTVKSLLEYPWSSSVFWNKTRLRYNFFGICSCCFDSHLTDRTYPSRLGVHLLLLLSSHTPLTISINTNALANTQRAHIHSSCESVNCFGFSFNSFIPLDGSYLKLVISTSFLRLYLCL